MHEISHIIVALLLKVDVQEVYLLPIGVNAKYAPKVSPTKELIISLAGPLASFLFAIFMKDNMYSLMNIGIGMFNLIPIYPMDGGRAIRSLLNICLSYSSAQKISYGMTKFFVLLLFFLSIISVAYFKNYYIGILTFYIFYLALDEIKKEKYFGLFNYLQNEQ